LWRTTAEIGPPNWAVSSTRSPGFSEPLTIADIPFSLISTLMPGMAKPAKRTVIDVLNKYRGWRRRSGPSNLAPGIAGVCWESRSMPIAAQNMAIGRRVWRLQID
jgi:hypothetical protein